MVSLSTAVAQPRCLASALARAPRVCPVFTRKYLGFPHAARSTFHTLNWSAAASFLKPFPRFSPYFFQPPSSDPVRRPLAYGCTCRDPLILCYSTSISEQKGCWRICTHSMGRLSIDTQTAFLLFPWPFLPSFSFYIPL